MEQSEAGYLMSAFSNNNVARRFERVRSKAEEAHASLYAASIALDHLAEHCASIERDFSKAIRGGAHSVTASEYSSMVRLAQHYQDISQQVDHVLRKMKYAR